MNASRRVYLLLVSIFVVLLGAQPATAQVSLTTLGSPTPLQTFDTLINTGSTTWTNNSTIPGWFHARTGTGTTIVANDGSSNAGNLYSYGTGTATDRALGSLGSGNAAVGNLFWGVRLQNNTGGTITSLDVQYVGEQWRNSAAAAQTVDFSYLVGSPTVTGSLAEFQSAGVAVVSGNFTSPISGGAAGALNGNLAANRTAKTFSITGLSIPNGTEVMLRWSDPDHTGADHGLSIDDFVVTPQGSIVNAPVVPTCATPLTTTTGTATSEGVSASDADGTVISATITGITPSDPGTITLTGFTPAGGVGGTANATLNVSAATPANTYSVTIQWANNDGSPQTANCVVSVVVNAPPVIAFIHDVQGNGASTPIPGATVTIEGVVTGDFQPVTNDNRLSGFFVQEETTDMDADPLTSEGIFVFCSACPTNVAEGQKVQVTGTVSEFNNLTEITATTAPSVVITNAGNNLAQLTTSTIDLPVVGVIDDFYEPMESMLVTFVDTLTISEYFEQARYGRIELYEGTRPVTFNETNPPSVAGFAAHNDNLNRRRVYLDDDDNVENSVLNLTDTQQFVFHPQANGGLSARNATNTGPGVQGTDFFRGGDTISSLTGILHYSFSGGTSPNEWRVRPVAASPAAFTTVNVRPPAPPPVGGAIRAASVNVLNYFTTLNVRGADSTAELNRQRERTSIVLCGLNADVAALMEIENHATNATIIDLLGAVNARCGAAGTDYVSSDYAFVNTGGALGTDQIRVMLIYRTGKLSPVGAPISDMNAVHNRPPTAQTFDVIAGPATGQRFTAVANHSKSKSCSGASGADLDQNDGQACFAATRLNQANQIISWVNGTVIPAASDPDVLMFGDFNAYPQETSAAAITGAGFTDLETALLGSAAYSYLFDGQIGHIDYAWSSASITPRITGVAPWHINADENPLFDYNDEIKDGAAEQTFEEKPDGSALATPRVMFQAATAQRASDHDPVLLGIFQVADVSITKTDSPDPVNAGTDLTYTITVDNAGPDAASTVSWSDTIPAGTTFVSLSSVAGWSCSDPGVGNNGVVSCSNPSFAAGNAVFTLVVHVDPTVAAGTVLSNTATATSATSDPDSGDLSDTETTTVAASADLVISKSDSPDPVTAGQNITYQMPITNNGPSNAASATFSDTLPAGTTFVSLSTTGPWSCTDPGVGNSGTVSCTNTSFGVTVDFFDIVVKVDPSVADGTVLSNTATVGSATTDPNSGNESATATTTVTTSADVSLTKTLDTSAPYTIGQAVTFTVTVSNAGPSTATSINVTDTPTNMTITGVSGACASFSPCTIASLAPGASTNITVNATIDSSGAFQNSATATAAESDPNNSDNTASDGDVAKQTNVVEVTKAVSGTFVQGTNVTYTIVMTNNMTVNQPDNFGHEFTDILPAGLTLVPASFTATSGTNGSVSNIFFWDGSIPSGGTVTLTFQATISATATGTICNQGQSIFDQDGDNQNEASELTDDPSTGAVNDATCFTVLQANVVEVTKAVSGTFVQGSNVTYTIMLTNNMTVTQPDNFGHEFTDNLPAGLTLVPASFTATSGTNGSVANIFFWDGSIPSGGTVTLTFQATISPTASGQICNQGQSIFDKDGDGQNESSELTDDPSTGPANDPTCFYVVQANVVETTKAVSGTFVQGTNVTYSITMTNNMTVTQPDNFGHEWTDILPAGLTLIPASITASSGTTGSVSNIVFWDGSIPSGGTVTLSFQATISPTASGQICNQGQSIFDRNGDGQNEAEEKTDDPSTGADDDPTCFYVVQSGIVEVTKAVSGTFVQGSNVTYTIVMTNNMTVTQPNNFGHEFTDNLPPGLTLLTGSFTATSGTNGSVSNIFFWDGSIPSGGTVTLTFQATIGASATGPICNQGQSIFDRNGDGQNEASELTNDPSTGADNDPTCFTVITAGADGDGDGVPDTVEQAAPNGGDGNGDGIPDFQQGTVASIPAATGSGYLTLQSSCQLQQVSVTTPGANPPPLDPGHSYPHGLIAFRAPCSTATFSLFVYGSGSVNSYRKYGPLPPGGPQQWYQLPGATFSVTTVGSLHPRRINFSLTDGGTGDDTPVDGVIVDQGGPAGNADIPTASEWGLMALALALAAFAALKLRA